MTDFDITEKRFEQDIEESLCTEGGYVKGDPKAFDRKNALDVATFMGFIKSSQPKEWEKYTKIYGDKSEDAIIVRFNDCVRKTGLLKVLRKGVMDKGVSFRFVFWKPETSINEKTTQQYQANILHCTRQLRYSLSNENSIDIVLFVNGIPLVSMELKNQFTGQDASNAIRQYQFDRECSSSIFEFNNRVLVHFAVDLQEVFMTTRLAGAKTYFLPFNQGSNGAGNVGGKGNPANSSGYQTAYLWEKVLEKDSLLEILHKYIHLEKKDGKENMIFPRYHQLDVVSKLLAHAKKNGSGHNYLIQHSAGSGKSNSIAWLSHRLAGLHNSDDEKIFRSVIVITDRKVLDDQLQETVYQFDHVEGVVRKIDGTSKQLRDAINDGASIIITTLQKFPVIYKEINGQGDKNKNFAIIIDEAHSSQTGDSAKKLKRALADTDKILEEYAKMQQDDEATSKDDEDKIIEELASHGKHDNLSFFAFTATPKDKTLQMFGTMDDNGNYSAFHIYSMRQAIEEGFILDVLKNYTTYNTFYRIVKSIPGDPVLETSSGIRAIKKFESLHPHNLAQKTAVIIEHFLSQTKHQIGGRAKAMVITASRLHAVRYIFEFRNYIKSKGYKGIDVLVAFSGEIEDGGEKWTEPKINKDKQGNSISETQLRNRFKDEFNVLIVAEKYQTGFDEPCLHTMYVDKKLSGVKAVQTLSRLNRTMKGKDSTFVLDFVNSIDDIQKAFEPYYEATILTGETDPNVIYDMKNTLDEFRIYDDGEVEKFAEIFFKTDSQSKGDLGKLNSLLMPARGRFIQLEEEKRDLFKTTLVRFVRVYSFISQICRTFDIKMHKFSVYAKFLHSVLPSGDVSAVDLEDKISLEYFKLAKDFDGEIPLEGSADGLAPITGDAGRKDKKTDTLSELLHKINDRFGTDFTEMDKVVIQIENDLLAEKRFVNFVSENDENISKDFYETEFKNRVATRCEKNDQFFTKLSEDADFFKAIRDLTWRHIQEKIKNKKK